MEFFAAECEEGFRLVAAGEAFAGYEGLSVCNYSNALLILVQLVALVLHVKNGPTSRLIVDFWVGKVSLPVLRRDLMRARYVPHGDMISKPGCRL